MLYGMILTLRKRDMRIIKLRSNRKIFQTKEKIILRVNIKSSLWKMCASTCIHTLLTWGILKMIIHILITSKVQYQYGLQLAHIVVTAKLDF